MKFKINLNSIAAHILCATMVITNFFMSGSVYAFDDSKSVNMDFADIESNLSYITSENMNEITKPLNFNITAKYGSTVSFSSSNKNVITNSGRIIRPKADESAVTVEVTMKVAKGDSSKTKNYNFTILPDEIFADPKYMSDEEFYGKWNGNSWECMGKLNYSSIPELSAVEKCVKADDYDGAKGAFLEYIRGKENAISPASFEKNVLKANAYADGILGEPDNNLLLGEFTSASNFWDSQAINLSTVTPDRAKPLTLRLMAWYNESDILEVKSRESDSAPYISLLVNGSRKKFYAIADATIRPGSKKSETESDKDILYARTFGEFLGEQTSQILLKFDFSSLNEGDSISGAKLVLQSRVSGSSGNSKRVLITREPDSSWEESDVSWDDFLGFVYNYNSIGITWDRADGDDIEVMYQNCRFRPMYAMTAQYTRMKDENFAYAMIRIMEDFILKKGNLPEEVRGQYPRSLDTAQRFEKWVGAVNHLAKSKYMTPDGITAIYKHIWDMGHSFNDHHATENNWYQNEMTIMFDTSYYLKELTESAEWTQRAFNHLSQIIFTNNFSDGSYKEGTLGYNAEAMNQYIAYKTNAEARGANVSKEYDDMLLKAAYYNRLMYTPDGRCFQWGDSGLSESSTDYLWPQIYDWFKDEEYNYIASYGRYGREPSWTSKVFFDNRTTTMRSSWDRNAKFLFTNVRGGGWHSNADDNHIFFSAYQRPLLTDTGIMSYSGGSPEKNYAVATIGHNTVEINNTSQYNVHFNPEIDEMPGSIDEWNSDKNADFLSQTAITNKDANHRRTILFVKPYGFIVSDYMSPNDKTKTNTYKQLWHMLPEAKLSVDDEKNTIRSNFSSGANVIVSSADNLSAQTGDGWFDYSYNEITPIKHGYFYKSQKGDTVIDSVVMPSENDVNANLTTERIDIGVSETTAAALKYTNISDGDKNTGYYYLSYETNPSKIRTFDKYSTDGEMAFVNENSDGKVDMSVMKNASHILDSRGNYVFKASKRISFASMRIENGVCKIECEDVKSCAVKFFVNIEGVSSVVINDGEVYEYETEFVPKTSLNIELPETVQNNADGRCAEFENGIDGYSPSAVTHGGTVSAYDGYLCLSRDNSSGELYWQDYINGTYGVDDGYVELSVMKSCKDVSTSITTSGGGYTVVLKWDSDGKLYGKYRDTPGDAAATDWKYICDIIGTKAVFKIFIYTDINAYSVCINGKMVSKALYSCDVNPKKSELVRVELNEGNVGDTIFLDYKRCGSITKYKFLPCNVTYDTSTVMKDGKINIKSTYIGYQNSDESDVSVVSALYDENGNLINVKLSRVASDSICENNDSYGMIEQSLSAGEADITKTYLKVFVLKDSMEPIMPSERKEINFDVPSLTPYNIINPLSYGDDLLEGNENGIGSYGDTSMFIRRTSDNEKTESLSPKPLIYRVYANRAYPITTAGVLKFKLYKSRSGFDGHFIVLPSNFVDMTWSENGDIYVCYRNSAEEQGPDAKNYLVGNVGDKTEIEVVIAFDVQESKYTMWIDSVVVVADKYSRAVYNNMHSVPTSVGYLRIYTEYGKTGDEFGIKDYGIYTSLGYGQ